MVTFSIYYFSCACFFFFFFSPSIFFCFTKVESVTMCVGGGGMIP